MTIEIAGLVIVALIGVTQIILKYPDLYVEYSGRLFLVVWGIVLLLAAWSIGIDFTLRQASLAIGSEAADVVEAAVAPYRPRSGLVAIMATLAIAYLVVMEILANRLLRNRDKTKE